jgi:hypothetical protein
LVEVISEQHAAECPADIIRFTTLDFESSLRGQGFEPNSYDVVIFSPTHLSSLNQHRSLMNFRKLLKSSGRLREITSKLSVNEHNDCFTPEPTETNWPEVFSKSGRIRIDTVVQPRNVDGQEKNGFVVSTMPAVDSHTSTGRSANWIIVINDSLEQKELARGIQSMLLLNWNLEPSIMLLSQLKQQVHYPRGVSSSCLRWRDPS